MEGCPVHHTGGEGRITSNVCEGALCPFSSGGIYAAVEHDLFCLGCYMRRRSYSWFAGLIFFLTTIHVAAQPVRHYTGGLNLEINDAFTWVLENRGYSAKSDPRNLMTRRALEKRLASTATAQDTTFNNVKWGRTIGRVLGPVAAATTVFEFSNALTFTTADDGQVMVETMHGGDQDISHLPVARDLGDIILEAPGFHYYRTTHNPPRLQLYRVMEWQCPHEAACSAPEPFTGAVSKDFTTKVTSPFPAEYWVNVLSRNIYGSPTYRRQLYRFSYPPESAPQLPSEKELMSWDEAFDKLEKEVDSYDQTIRSDTLASLINHLWRSLPNASETGGVGYPAGRSITASEIDVMRLYRTLPASTVGNLFEPVAPVGENSRVPLVPNADAENPTDPSNPGSGGGGGQVDDGVDTDWGVDPGTPFPQLEEIPTAQMILDPLLNMMPDLREANFDGISGSCPIGEFDLYGSVHVMDQHCILMEQNRGAIELAMTLLWSVLSLLVVLRA